MSKITRRTFLKRSAALVGGALVSGTSCFPTPAIGVSSRKIIGANDRINIGVAGIRGRGKSHMKAFGNMKNVVVSHLIDPDSRLFQSRTKELTEKGYPAPKCVQDIREALEDKDLDAVSIATCNHWHSLIGVWACQAGKDVYVEKPCSHNVFEGRKLVEAARKYNRIVQHGSQRRADKDWASAAALARSGQLGKLLVSYGWASKSRSSIGFEKPENPPQGLDFNLWLGPAPMQPFHKNLVHYNWHWFWDFGNADTGNQGVHQMDVARWGLPDDAVNKPIKIVSLGGRFQWNDQGETPNAHLTIFDYDDTQLVFESCNLVTKTTRTVTNAFHTEQGVITAKGFTPHGSRTSEPLPQVEPNMGAGGDIFENFVRAMRSGKHTDLVADVLEAHRSSLLCHLGAICYRLGEVSSFDKSRKAFGDNKVAYEALQEMEGRMKSRGVKIDSSLKYKVGPVLTFDQKTERFIGDHAAAANKMLSRKYRKPFVVPKKV